MRVVQLPSVYDQPSEKPLRRMSKSAMVGLIAAGFAGCIVGALFLKSQWPIFVFVAGTWAMCVGFVYFVGANDLVTQGEAGERLALRCLASLPEDYFAVTGFKIPGYERIGDVDIIVVGPPGVVVIEVKNYLRACVVDADTWTMVSKYQTTPIKSPTLQARDLVAALTKYLQRENLGSTVHGIVAVNPNASIKVEQPPSFPIVPYDRLSEAILALKAARSPLTDAIERKLCASSATTT